MLRHRTLLLTLLSLGMATTASVAGPRQVLLEGNQALEAGQVEDAKTRYLQGFVEDPESPSLHYSMGLAHLRTGETEEAARYFEKAAELAEGQADTRLAARARYNLGLCLAGGDGMAPAAPALTRGPAAPPQAPVLGAAAAAPAGKAVDPKQLQAAVQAFKRAIQLDPRDLDAKYNFLKLSQQQQQQQQESGEEGEEGEKGEDESKPDEKNRRKNKKGSSKDEQQQSESEPQDQSEGDQGQPGESQQDPNSKPGEPKPPEDPEESPGDSGEKKDPPKPPESSDGDSQDEPGKPPAEGQAASGGEAKAGEAPDEQAMARFLDALEAESKEHLKNYLRSRQAAPRKVTHDW